MDAWYLHHPEQGVERMNAVQASLCPDPQALLDFGLGKLDEQSSNEIQSHLECCPTCRRTVAAAPHDSFVNSLRAASRQNAGDSDIARPPLPWSGKSVAAAAASAAGAALLADPGSADTVTFPPPGGSSDQRSEFFLSHADYEVIAELGRGGMGIAYLARHRVLDRLEVLKILNKRFLRQPDALQRFTQEIRSAARLNHPNIVAAYGTFRSDDHVVLVMEYVAGENLKQLVVRDGPLPAAAAIDYACQVATGLQHACERGLVHRDIKPSNLILSLNPDPHVKILDFGLAKIISEESGADEHTLAGEVLGTPHYMAPEQFDDSRGADIRADIYSLGCTLFFLLAGQPPFQRDGVMGLLHAHHVEPPPLATLQGRVPEGLLPVLAKMMAKSPADRYQTPAEVLAALESLPAAADVPGATQPRAKRRRQAAIASEAMDATPDRSLADESTAKIVGSSTGPAALQPSAATRSSTLFKNTAQALAAGGGCLSAVVVLGLLFRAAPEARRPASAWMLSSSNNSPVCVFLRPPEEAMHDYADRFKQTLVAIKNGNAGKLDPIEEFNRQEDDRLWLPSGTFVEPVGDDDASLKISKGSGLVEQLGALAKANNVRVRVLEGTAEGREVWVARTAVRRAVVPIP